VAGDADAGRAGHAQARPRRRRDQGTGVGTWRAAWAIELAPELAGALDHAAGFVAVMTGHPLLCDLHARLPGIRIGRTRRVLQALVPAIIEQKVTGGRGPRGEARAAFVALARRHWEPAPGPWDEPSAHRRAALRVPPGPETLAGLPGYAYHPLGLERRRGDAIRIAAAHATRVEECADLSLPDAYARLQVLPLVGAWTAAEVGLRALGDADAVSVGDFHLCHAVSLGARGRSARHRRADAGAACPVRRPPGAGRAAHRGRRDPRSAPRPADGPRSITEI
jgi:3-methyladenine DNA glycosylase/8-oxoguanine DNA glycosylase